MTIAFFLVISAFVVGMGCLVGTVQRWASAGRHEERGAVSRVPRTIDASDLVIDIPDRVPAAWVEAYRADQDG